MSRRATAENVSDKRSAPRSDDSRIVEVVDGPIKSERPSKASYRTAVSGGKSLKVRVVKADSPTFAADFQDAFKANVRRARRENRRLKADA